MSMPLILLKLFASQFSRYPESNTNEERMGHVPHEGAPIGLIDNFEFYMHFLFLIYVSSDPVSNVLDIILPTSMACSLAYTQI